MSWQGYVDNLVATGRVEKAAILGGADGGAWATTPGLVQGAEGAGLVQLYKNPANVFASGVTVGGVKYMGIKGDERSIYGKKGATGIAIAKSGQAIVIGYYNEKQQPGNAAIEVEKVADYLIENGY